MQFFEKCSVKEQAHEKSRTDCADEASTNRVLNHSGPKKTLAKVSVADLTRASGINRGTLLHYLDKDDLVAKVEASLLGDLERGLDIGMDTAMNPNAIVSGKQSPLMVNMVHLINQRRDICQFLLSPVGDPSLLGRVAKLLRDKILGHLAELKAKPILSTIFLMLTSARSSFMASLTSFNYGLMSRSRALRLKLLTF